VKKGILFVVIIAIAVYVYKILDDNPSVITNPVYLESRVRIDIPDTSRALDVVFIGEMASRDDCAKRKDYYLDNLLENCRYCAIKVTECKLDIHSRYKTLFSDRKTHTTYLSLTKGSRFERNGRIVVWSLTDEEANFLCNGMKAEIDKKYTGTVKCI
jgi:hypothetical protein